MELKNEVKHEFDKIESTGAQKAELSHRVKMALHREENKKQKQRSKSLWLRVVASSMAFVLICGTAIGGYFLFRGGDNNNINLELDIQRSNDINMLKIGSKTCRWFDICIYGVV